MCKYKYSSSIHQSIHYLIHFLVRIVRGMGPIPACIGQEAGIHPKQLF